MSAFFLLWIQVNEFEREWISMNQTVSVPGTPGKLTGNKSFMLLITAQLISNVGDWLNMLALLTMVGLRWKATPWEITALTLCMAVPMLLGGPVSGYLSDKINRKAMMIGSDIARVGIVAAFIFAGSLWQVYVLLLVKGVMDVMFSPAKSGKMKEIVAPEHIDQAMRISSSIEQLTKIAGPAVGGILLASAGISACFIIDSVSYLISAVLLLGLPKIGQYRTARSSEAGKAKATFRQEMGEGLRFIYGIPTVLGGLVMLLAVLLVVQIADSQLIVLFREIPGISDGLLGWCVAASGAGTLLAAVTAGKLGSAKHPLALMCAGTMLMGLIFASCGILIVNLPAGMLFNVVLYLSFMLVGAGAGYTFIPFFSMLQRRTPETHTGRVFGTVNSMTSAAVILGPVIGGALVTASGPVTAFLLSGIVTALLGALFLLLRGKIGKKELQAGGAVPESAAV